MVLSANLVRIQLLQIGQTDDSARMTKTNTIQTCEKINRSRAGRLREEHGKRRNDKQPNGKQHNAAAQHEAGKRYQCVNAFNRILHGLYSLVYSPVVRRAVAQPDLSGSVCTWRRVKPLLG